MRIYVGNLPFSMREDELRSLFEQHGEVGEVNIIVERDTGRSRGFGFVTMDSAEAGAKAIEALNGFESQGRALRVNEARPRPERRGGGGGGGGGGGRGRGGRGGRGGGGRGYDDGW